MTEITVKQLKALLAQVPDDTLVVLARDVEGNGFSPAASYTEVARYIPGHRPWLAGDIYTQTDPEFQSDRGQPAVVLWPAH